MTESTYSIPVDSDGIAPYTRTPLYYATGSSPLGVMVSGPGQFQMTSTYGGYLYSYLQRIDAVCVATGMTSGYWNLLSHNGVGYSVSASIVQAKAPVNPGERITVEFANPLRSGARYGYFGIQGSTDNMGIWFFTVNGFMKGD